MGHKLIFVPILAIFLKITISKHNSVGLCTIHDVANTHAACPVCGYIWIDEYLTKKLAHFDQDLTHLKLSDSFSKSPFCGPKWNRGHARQLVLVSNPRFLGPGNHLGPFTWCWDRSDGQKQGGGAVGSHLILILILVSSPIFFGYRESFETIFRILSSITGLRGCRRPSRTSWSKIVNLVLIVLETLFWYQCNILGMMNL